MVGPWCLIGGCPLFFPDLALIRATLIKEPLHAAPSSCTLTHINCVVAFHPGLIKSRDCVKFECAYWHVHVQHMYHVTHAYYEILSQSDLVITICMGIAFFCCIRACIIASGHFNQRKTALSLIFHLWLS